MHRKPYLFILCLLSLATVVSLLPKPRGGERASNDVRRPAATKPRIVESYGRLPLSFELNQGQTDSRAKFVSRGLGYTLFLNSTEAVLSLNRRVGGVLRMKIVGANPESAVAGVDELPGKSNYFIGNDPGKWRTDIPTYRKVRYRNVYPGVDLIYHGNQRRLEYDFVVAAGADPRAIRLEMNGAGKAEIDAQGNLLLGTEGGQIRLHKPVVYQEFGGVRREIVGGLVLRDHRRVSFDIAAYDATKPLVIDPVLAYSTYLGGTGSDVIDFIAVDSSGSAYVSGRTTSTDFPATDAAFQTNKNSQDADAQDAFVAKLNPEGTALVYATYLGGSLNTDQTAGLTVASSGDVYVAGHTFSTDFPIAKGAFQETTDLRKCGTAANKSPCSGIFVTRLNATGTALVYSTYLGGTDDYAGGIAVDSGGNAYVTGYTSASTFPTTPGAFQTSFAPTTNTAAFVTKLNATGTALVYSTFLGGRADQTGNNLVVDSGENVYVIGSTTSTDFPTTAGAFQKTVSAGNCGTVSQPSPCNHVFVTKLNAAGTALVYSTYLGGSRNDLGNGLAVDASGALYVTGSTNSSNFPVASAFQNTLAGGNCGSGGAVIPCSNVFIAKLDPTGSALVYSTFLGGDGAVNTNGGDSGADLAVDPSGNIYVVGINDSSNFPAKNPLDLTGCPCPNFVAKLNPAGTLVYSIFLGDGTAANGVRADSSGAYVAGATGSEDFTTTEGAFQTSLQGDTAGFIKKIVDQTQ